MKKTVGSKIETIVRLLLIGLFGYCFFSLLMSLIASINYQKICEKYAIDEAIVALELKVEAEPNDIGTYNLSIEMPDGSKCEYKALQISGEQLNGTAEFNVKRVKYNKDGIDKEIYMLYDNRLMTENEMLEVDANYIKQIVSEEEAKRINGVTQVKTKTFAERIGFCVILLMAMTSVLIILIVLMWIPRRNSRDTEVNENEQGKESKEQNIGNNEHNTERQEQKNENK